jgi:hypothetical protein
MPYIKPGIRAAYSTVEMQIEEMIINHPGNLNYLLTLMCQNYAEYNGNNYQSYNDIVGALECCKLEFYRRAVAPYEDVKIEENGDVY